MVFIYNDIPYIFKYLQMEFWRQWKDYCLLGCWRENHLLLFFIWESYPFPPYTQDIENSALKRTYHFIKRDIVFAKPRYKVNITLSLALRYSYCILSLNVDFFILPLHIPKKSFEFSSRFSSDDLLANLFTHLL